MTDLEKRLNEAMKSQSVTDRIAKESVTNSKFGGTEETARKYAEKMKEILQAKIQTDSFIGSRSGEYFLDHLDTRVYFVDGEGWIADVFFIESDVHRDSLYPAKYPEGVYLPVIYNNGYEANDYVYGVWHGEHIRSKLTRAGTNFIQEAVEQFRREVDSNIEIEIDPMYDI